MTTWRRPIELGDLDIAGALDATQAQIDRIARWAERLAVGGRHHPRPCCAWSA